jgi:hypothetical protein
MPVPAASAARTAASRSADSLGRPKALPLLVPFGCSPLVAKPAFSVTRLQAPRVEPINRKHQAFASSPISSLHGAAPYHEGERKHGRDDDREREPSTPSWPRQSCQKPSKRLASIFV